ANGLRLVSASAGSGKTFRLTEEVIRAVNPSAPAMIEMDGLIGVTYTKKAQAELEARIRRVLVENGAFERAQQLPLAYLGTVHAVCLRLLKEFALDAGLSPEVDVIPGNEGRRLLQAALEHELPGELHARIEDLARKLQLEWLPRTSRNDWVTPVEDIMTLVRGNRISPDRLPTMAERSRAGLLALLPPAVTDGRALEVKLASAIASAVEQLDKLDNGVKKAEEALELLRDSAAALDADRLLWSGWAKLAKVDPGKHGFPLVAAVRDAASGYETHPEFRAELGELVQLIFEAARIGLVAYADWKGQRGLVDYVDMIDRGLAVLDVPEVAHELGERLSLLVVDEFQDTSPIQLALFMRLHALSKASVWVGDRKQCIFEYAGADPTLMEAVNQWAGQSGGERDFLTHNYRSRPELVAYGSTLFSAAFAGHGFAREEVITTAKRPHLPELECLPPVAVWWLEGKEEVALADGVARLLAIPEATPVLDRATERTRALRASDIAVLVYSNADAKDLSAALKARGITSVLPRAGLLATPEGTLVAAGLRALLDPHDALAVAEIEALTGFTGKTPDEWLSDRIQQRNAKRDASEPAATEPQAQVVESERLSRIAALRAEFPVLSPAEALDRVLAVLDVASLAVRWPDPTQRLANLEALRALAAAYEERCSYQREAASLAGLLRYFEETQQVIRQRDEERATDEQHVGGSDNAVIISTYHKAKGLEWPVVILGSLGRPRKRDPFAVTPESDRTAFDAADPLGERWIRYWPWPLGGKSGVPLMERAANSDVGRAVIERDARERVRLLYVGWTRARDHLILGVHLLKKGPATSWLDELSDQRGPLLTLPEPGSTEPSLGIRGLDGERLSVPVRVWSFKAENTEERTDSTEPRFRFARATGSPETPPYRVTPSDVATHAVSLPQARVISTHRFAARMPFVHTAGVSRDRIGTALHAFLAADYPELSHADRVDLGVRLLAGAGLDASITAAALISSSDSLRGFVATRWPDALWHREVPVSAALDSEHGLRRIEGTIDLLLETPAGFVIIDHKSFPGSAAQWAAKALEYAPQLMTYAMTIEMSGGLVLGRFIHFTVGGGMVELATT
ncbi:MAG: UvrD-helicase domain-containing protein, partial [Polyangiaceae bacterium]